VQADIVAISPPDQEAPNIAEFTKWLAYHATKDWPVLVKAPVAVTSVLLLALFLAWLFIWHVVVPLKDEQLKSKQGTIDQKQATIDSYKERQAGLDAAIKSSASGSVQMVIFTNDPNIEKLTPPNTNAPAMAYGDGGDKPTFTWSIKQQAWR
jgi:hypothetical protein